MAAHHNLLITGPKSFLGYALTHAAVRGHTGLSMRMPRLLTGLAVSRSHGP